LFALPLTLYESGFFCLLYRWRYMRAVFAIVFSLPFFSHQQTPNQGHIVSHGKGACQRDLKDKSGKRK